MTKIKLITFDLDDTLWDNGPTITNAEIQTRKWIEERGGEVESVSESHGLVLVHSG